MTASDDALTLTAIGAAAASLAAIFHETIGHGSGCIAVGGHVTLLTSIYFRCYGATAWTDAAGPLGNLIAGAAALAFLQLRRGGTAATRLFVTLVAAINLCWFAGQTLYSGLFATEDLAFVARSLSWPDAWRAGAIVAGLAVYALGGRFFVLAVRALIVPGEARANGFRRIGIAYTSAAASAALAGLLWAKDPWGSATLGVLAVGAASIPFLLAMRRAERLGSSRDDARPIERSWLWLIAGFGIFLAFAIIQGRGIGPLA